MFNIPDRYKVDMVIPLKDFIPKELKPNDKKRIKEAIKSVKLTHQIVGEEIPSVVNDQYNCQVIQFYDIEVTDIKVAAFLSSTYQNFIKPYCVIHIYDRREEVFSFAVKRLNQQDASQIVIESNLVTEKYSINLPDEGKNRMLVYMNYLTIKNKLNKVDVYREWYSKAYILAHEKAYESSQMILDGNFWYDNEQTKKIIKKYKSLVDARAFIINATGNAERMKANKLIKIAIEELEHEKF